MSTLKDYPYPTEGNPNATGSGINTDAWGRQKVINDQTLLHGMFTYDVPLDKWKESLNGVELVEFTNATSIDGKLSLKSGATLNDVVVLDSYRNPRYQPNRGHLYSSSIFLPNPTANGVRDFGFFTGESGIFFRLKSDGLYACRQISILGVPQPPIEEKIDESSLPDTLDLSKGNIYDIQMQWRGVGDIKFFIGDDVSGVSRHVHTMKHLNRESELSTWNPANPIAFRCENLGDNVEIQCGCVDVSTEGGESSTGSYGSISVNNQSGQISMSGFNDAALAVRSVDVFNGLRNTRDTLALLATSYSDQRSFLRVWATRDQTAITLNDQAWSPFRDGHLEFLIKGLNGDGTTGGIATPFVFDPSKATLIFGSRSPQYDSYATSALFEGRADIYQTPGDILIFTLHRENGSNHNGGVTFEFAEEI